MRYGVVVEELVVEGMAEPPSDQARKEVLELIETVRRDLAIISLSSADD